MTAENHLRELQGTITIKVFLSRNSDISESTRKKSRNIKSYLEGK